MSDCSIFVYEFVTGGGVLTTAGSDEPSLPSDSLLAEGRAMLTAVTADFCKLRPQVREVAILWDARLPRPPSGDLQIYPVSTVNEAKELFQQMAAAADHTVVIAPEFSGCLLRCSQTVLAAGGKLLGPSAELVGLAADKQATAMYLGKRGVPVPQGIALAAGDPWPTGFPTPAVLKPRCGAGSLGMRLLCDPLDRLPPAPWADEEPAWRLEAFCPGMAASVSVLNGPPGSLVLPGANQCLSADGNFAYQGGSWPLSAPLRHRAEALAARVVTALPRTKGYFGIDLVLGAPEDGSQDVVVEINPRLTTSYVGLRAAALQNLTAAMLDLATEQGLPTTADGSRGTMSATRSGSCLRFNATPLTFTAQGEVNRASQQFETIAAKWIPADED